MGHKPGTGPEDEDGIPPLVLLFLLVLGLLTWVVGYWLVTRTIGDWAEIIGG